MITTESNTIGRKGRGESAAENLEGVHILSDTHLQSHVTDGSGPYTVHVVIEEVFRQFDRLTEVLDLSSNLVCNLWSRSWDSLCLRDDRSQVNTQIYFLDIVGPVCIFLAENHRVPASRHDGVSIVIIEFLIENGVKFCTNYCYVLRFIEHKFILMSIS